MTICHKPDDEGEYTDEQFYTHLITSECSECVKAGHRFKEVLTRLAGYEAEQAEIRKQIDKNIAAAKTRPRWR